MVWQTGGGWVFSNSAYQYLVIYGSALMRIHAPQSLKCASMRISPLSVARTIRKHTNRRQSLPSHLGLLPPRYWLKCSLTIFWAEWYAINKYVGLGAFVLIMRYI